MDNQINVETALKSTDSQEFNLWFSLNSRIILTAFTVAAYFAVMLLITKDYSTQSLTILTATSVALAPVLWWINRSSIVKKSKKAFESDALAQQPQSYTITEEGIHYESEAGSGQVKWEEIFKIGETVNLFVFFVSSNRALIIPKRFFNSEQDKAGFKDVARKHMFSNRVKFKS
ncbi:YcxB family protein [Paenibacillus donghaensis]|uniref:YcxB-like C-terminal domain-containing protein n=1 Tax=Paenibacillus donghaensis TaxID=414771 RepID=A0A2Z2KWY9_9BACL|nr:YcxB family protein [Paenibacillus donghaensis]ASA24678.1 hypothetical protein B9T62_30340 [Paenibacillus donghaensis]